MIEKNNEISKSTSKKSSANIRNKSNDGFVGSAIADLELLDTVALHGSSSRV